MTERFSPEYIAFILSDEASVLQKEWKKRGVRKGDWVWDAGTETGRVRLVTSTETHTWLLDFLLDGTARRWTAEVDWLPTLTDLLDMIEEAGWEWEKRLDGTVEAHREIGYHEEYDQYEYESTGNIYGGGIMRTFAKLAVRALEEGKE